MYKAVFLDMDGTLLRSDHSISEATRQTIQRILKNGIAVILVSARPYDGMIDTAQAIGTGDYPIVSLNGSYIVKGEDVLYQSVIDLKTTADIARQLQAYDATPVYYLQREWYASVNDQWVQHEQRIMQSPIRVQTVDHMLKEWRLQETAPNKILVMGAADTISSAQQKLVQQYNDQLNIYPSKTTYLEVMNSDASKASAIKRLIQQMDIGRGETLAIGDNFNDQEMIRYAGTGIAMGNAPDEIKAAADYVTDTNNNDGVRKALELFLPA